MDLRAHVSGPGTIADIAAYVHNLPPERRWEELASLGKGHQRTLFLKAQGSAAVQRDDLVAEAGHVVVHRGRNSLPVFRDFSKPMVATDEGAIWGFNEGVTRRWLGPGYFRCRPCEGPVETGRSAWVVDYFQVPDARPTPDWPAIRPNSRGLSWFVFHQTRDYLRRVADGVLIGSAYRTILGRERKLDSYFLLLRR